MAGIFGNVTGFDALANNLASLSRAVSHRIAQKAVREAIQPELVTARALAPSRTGALRRSLGYVVKTYFASRVTVGVVGARKDHQEGRNRVGRYAAIIEHGRGPVHAKNKRVLSDGHTIYGRKVRAVPGVYFLQKARDFTQHQAQRILANVVSQELANLQIGG